MNAKKIYIVEEYDATRSYEASYDGSDVEESRSILGAYFSEAAAKSEAAGVICAGR